MVKNSNYYGYINSIANYTLLAMNYKSQGNKFMERICLANADMLRRSMLLVVFRNYIDTDIINAINNDIEEALKWME